MQMVYNSDAFAVVEIELPASTTAAGAAPDAGEAASDAPPGHVDGGFEIVDKMARTDIFLTGDLARSFREGVEELSRGEPTADEVDAFISRFTGLPQQPLVLH